VGRNVLNVLHAAVDALDLGMQRARLAGGQHTAGAALEQRHAQLDLEMPDEPADAGLRDVQQPGGAGDAAGLHHRSENYDLAQIHASTPAVKVRCVSACMVSWRAQRPARSQQPHSPKAPP
jgi:hypothetical protein